MANVIIKSEDRKQQEAQILRDFGKNAQTASKADREKAAYIAAKTKEMTRNWRG